MQIHDVFHVSLLIPDRERPADMEGQERWGPIEESEGADPTYEVENILDQRGESATARYLKNGKVFLY